MRMLRDVLVGYTGFVGSHLREWGRFDGLYNSKNFESLRGQRCERLVFSASRAEKWIANREPAADAAHIDQLISVLQTVAADEFVLISTVDVYANPQLETERWIE